MATLSPAADPSTLTRQSAQGLGYDAISSLSRLPTFSA
jgi:hypothetical protein